MSLDARIKWLSTLLDRIEHLGVQSSILKLSTLSVRHGESVRPLVVATKLLAVAFFYLAVGFLQFILASAVSGTEFVLLTWLQLPVQDGTWQNGRDKGLSIEFCGNICQWVLHELK